VTIPGPQKYEDNLDIMDALALAGGPSPDADIKKAKIVTKDGYYAQSLHFNLEEYTKTGALPRYTMRREDTFMRILLLFPAKGLVFWALVSGQLLPLWEWFRRLF